ncbi:hypothetical protein EC957_008794 [Mortierella hygrophila]|uniref:PUM-HD domain-containing protein n=1 Tax=Mortierella hygrophila TaxID=979708 RepID=A0A9P6JXY7_9FUNG|nr:hypothetical protein EC957_008794 [Mortierella hygrophila]
MIDKARLDKLLWDSYANYVDQTSLDFTDPIQRTQLVKCIRPLLPAISNIPYRKRIQGKLHPDQMSGVNNSTAHLGLNGGMNGCLNGGMNGGMNGSMNGGMPMANMGGMNGAMSGGMNRMNVNSNMNGNMMGFGFPG